jgi:hypothetical protein
MTDFVLGTVGAREVVMFYLREGKWNDINGLG